MFVICFSSFQNDLINKQTYRTIYNTDIYPSSSTKYLRINDIPLPILALKAMQRNKITKKNKNNNILKYAYMRVCGLVNLSAALHYEC